MIVEQISYVYSYVQDLLRTKQYTVLKDPKTHATYIECIVYTREANLLSNQQKGSNVDKMA